MNRILFCTIFGFLFGVAIASFGVDLFLVESLLVFGGIFFLFGCCIYYGTQFRLVWVIFFITAMLFGVARMQYVAQAHTSDRIIPFIGDRVTLQGIVVTDPDTRIDQQKITIKVDAVRTDNEIVSMQNVHVLVATDRHDDIAYGDMIWVTGKLQEPENFVTDTGREFDYTNYLAKDNIFYHMFYPDIEVVGYGYGSRVTSWMLSLKHVLVHSINRIFSQPEGALLAGELFGEKSALGGELQTAFRRTGVIHIVVLSGFNITIVATFMIWILTRFLHPRIAQFFGIAGIVMFAMLVGGGATVIRASVMAILAIIARVVGRDYDVTRALFLAAFIMVLHNPKILVFDISFQLSFLATLSLIYIAPYIENKLGWVTTTFELRETLVQTLSAQVFVLPLLLYAIGEFSIVSVLVNILVVPLVPWAMLFGFITGVIGLVSQILATVPMVPAYVLLKLQLIFVEWFNRLSFAVIHIPPIPWWSVAVLYSSVGLWVMRRYTKNILSSEHESSSKFVQTLH